MSVTQALSAALIQFLWQGSMVGFLLWVTLLGLRKRSANARYLVSCGALAVVAVLPLVTTALLFRRTLPVDASTPAFMDIPGTIAATLLGLAPAQLEAVLAHELAHIRRHDYLVNLLQMLVETTLFYHPAVWWTSQRIRLERELCCDDLAVRSCGDPLGYARALMTLEKLRVTAPSVTMGMGTALLPRIQRLVGAPAREGEPWRVLGAFTMCAGLTCCALSLSDVHVQARSVPIGRTSHTGIAVVTGTPAMVTAPSIEDWARVQLHVVVGASESERRSAGALPINWSCVDGSEMLCGPPSVLQEFERDRKEHDQTQDARYVLDAAMAQPLRIEYPHHLREARVEGTVALEGRIGTDGFLTKFQVRASGDPDFERAAIAAIRRWRWDPARVNGIAVEVPITLTIDFKIES